jgi:hypothetical protein
MSAPKPYEAEGFYFEFSPNGNPYVGALRTTNEAESGPYEAEVNLRKPGSRERYARKASELYGMETTRLERALNEVCTLRAEEVEAAKAKSEEAAGEERPERSCPYRETPGGLVWDKPTQNGSVPTPLTNFTARIVRDIAEDDGAEVRRNFEIEAFLNGRRDSFSVPSAQFTGMGWATEHLGASAIMYPGFGTKDHARAAVQMLSGDVPAERVYAHTGWREVSGEWVYLHAGGAIGQVGQVEDIRTELSGSLGKRVLPDPPKGEELVRAIRASLDVLTLAPDRLMFPMLAAVYRALLGETDFGLHLSGPTGEGKSEIAALCQQHHGAGLDARNLSSWESTENAIEGQAFQAKDQTMVLDDFAPTGSSYDVQRWHKKADRVLRAKGNAAGRGRMNSNLAIRPDKPPRALIFSTGEDVPRGQSLRARLLVLELAPGELRWEKLTSRQRDAANGLYAAAGSGYVRWLAARYGETKGGLSEERAALREAAAKAAQHRRTPGIIADLALGLGYLLYFAHEAGALSTMHAMKLWERGWRALGEAAADQQGYQAAGEPTGRFRELLSAAVASGRAHVADPDGEKPSNADAWGWRVATVGRGDFEREEWKPQGDRVGWAEDEDLYLEPDAAYAAVQKQGRDSGDSLSVTERTLRKRLHERGLLQSVDDKRQVLTIRRKLESRRRGVLHLSSSFLSPDSNKPDQPDHGTQEPLRNGEYAPPLWSGSDRKPDHDPTTNPTTRRDGRVTDGRWSGSEQEPDHAKDHTYQENASHGRVGQVIEMEEEISEDKEEEVHIL